MEYIKNLMKDKKRATLIVSIAITLVLFGISYAFFNYRGLGKNHQIVSGDIYMVYTSGSETVYLTNVVPETATEARARNDNYLTFSIRGRNTSGKDIYYEILLDHGDDLASPKKRFKDEDLRFDLVLLDANDNEVSYLIDSGNYNDITNKRIWVETIDANTTAEINIKYKLRVWLADSVIISDTDPYANYKATGADGFGNYYTNIKLSVYGDFVEKKIVNGYQSMLEAIDNKSGVCTPTWTDTMGTNNDTSDDVIYFSGGNSCIDMNYVWYSGKLWRIVALYPNGTMKMVTEHPITTIDWNDTIEYRGSYVYQWLNEDFYDTLYNQGNIIVMNSTWNYSEDSSATSTPVRPETIAVQKTVQAPVGLLSAYEYYNSGASTSYLNIELYNWTLTTTTSDKNILITHSGSLSNDDTAIVGSGVRPTVNLRTGVEFTGIGTLANPYRIVGDKEIPEGYVTFLNTRLSGEFVKFDGDLYRIVDTHDGLTKLIHYGYYEENDVVVKKALGNDGVYGNSINVGNDGYWDYFLNNTWYNSISSVYKNMLVDDTYYLGTISSIHDSYKSTVCKDVNLNSVTMKNCTRYTSSDTGKTLTAKVGLPRVGEMFAAQISNYAQNEKTWLITPPTYFDINILLESGIIGGIGSTLAAQPTITLKSDVKIESGSGTMSDPFEIYEILP